MSRLKRRDANRRFTIILLGALLLSMWGLIGYWSWSQRQSELASNAVVLAQLTTAVEEQTLRMFKQAETSLVVGGLWMAEHPHLDPASAPGFIQLIEQCRQLSDGLLDFRMVTRAGGLVYIPRLAPDPLANVADRDYFSMQMDPATRGFFIAAPLISRVTGKWGIPVSIPIDDAGGDIGVMFSAIELDRFAGVLEAERLKPYGSIALYRSDGVVLFRAPHDEKLIGTSIASTKSWAEHFARNEREVFLSDGSLVDGRPRQVSFARLKAYPLIAVVTAGIDEVLAPWRHTTALLVSIGTAVTIGSLLLGTILIRAMKAEEKALRETERAHRDARLILTSAGEGICGLDADGRIGFINPAARIMLGWGDSDPVGQKLHTVSHHSHADGTPYPEEECPICRTITDGQTREVQDELFWRQDGSTLPVEFIVTGVIEERRVTGAVLVFRDVSERLATERALMAQANELARSNSDLEQFAYVASHDLREPLRQVSSFVTLLERRYGDLVGDEGREFIGFARDGAKRMDHLIVDLLEFSRIGHRALPTEPVLLGEVIDDAITLLGTRIVESGAAVQRDKDFPTVLAVRDDMMRLFQNLIGNALKYRDPSRTPVVSVTAARRDGEWVISVIDNGIGIDQQYADRIFGIFQRLHTRDKFEGTGIGLAICKKIVEQAGGRIWVDSAPGQGSMFHVTLSTPA